MNIQIIRHEMTILYFHQLILTFNICTFDLIAAHHFYLNMANQFYRCSWYHAVRSHLYRYVKMPISDNASPTSNRMVCQSYRTIAGQLCQSLRRNPIEYFQDEFSRNRLDQYDCAYGHSQEHESFRESEFHVLRIRLYPEIVPAVLQFFLTKTNSHHHQWCQRNLLPLFDEQIEYKFHAQWALALFLFFRFLVVLKMLEHKNFFVEINHLLHTKSL